MKKKPKKTKKQKKEIDVLSHHLVPKTEILNEDAKKRILKKYGITEDQLPKLRSNDPIAKALGAKIGDVVKSEREDITGKYNVYRVVVSK